MLATKTPIAAIVMRACLARDGMDRLTSRQERGIEIASAFALRNGKRGVWIVQSQSSDEEYRVNDSCECPDNAPECKHGFAVRCIGLYAEELVGRIDRDEQWDGTIEDVQGMHEEYLRILQASENYALPTGLMLTGFHLEAIGDDAIAVRKMCQRAGRSFTPTKVRHLRSEAPWVARIGGLCPQFEFVRDFQERHKDYRNANKTGSRGVYCYYELPSGLYEIKELLSFDRSRRFFARVGDGQIKEISKREVLACLASNPS